MAIHPDFPVAFEHYKVGRLDAAEQSCRQVLAAEPNHADALHLLGLVAYARGRHEDAASLITRAIQADGSRPTFHNNLGNVLKEQGKLNEAVECYRHSLQLSPAPAAIL